MDEVATLRFIEKFSLDELRLESIDNDKVMGFIVSNKVENLDDETRQDIIWQILRKYLSAQERSNIIALLALTQDEEMAYSS